MSYQPDKKELVKEIVRCGKDPAYFLNNYTKISHPMRGLIPFQTYQYQDELLTSFNDHRFNVILKARQLGITTLTAGYIVWMMLFHRDKNILVMATKYTTAANLVKKVKAIMKGLPPWIRVATINVDNRTSFELTNGSQIKASSTSVDAGRSEALSLLVLDEAAHIENLEELWMGLYPTLSTGGRCIALSTPNGVGNWFHQACIDAAEENNDFFLTSLPWDSHPDRDTAWYEKETRNMSRREIAQELECNFNMSGETVIHPEDVEIIENSIEDPKHRTGFDRNFYIWKEYDPTHSYLLSADVARGDGRDFSVFHIIDLVSLEQVAEYQGKPDIDFFARILFDAGNEYGNAMLVVENNNIGYSVLTKLIDMGYSNLYYSTKGSHEYLDPLEAEHVSNSIPGFTTSAKTRPLIIAKFEEFIRNKLITLRSRRLLNELTTFIWHNGKPQAMRGYNDDLIMSLAIACWVRDTALVVNQRDREYKQAMVGGMRRASTQLDTTIPGMQGHSMNPEWKKEIEQMKKYEWLYKG